MKAAIRESGWWLLLGKATWVGPATDAPPLPAVACVLASVQAGAPLSGATAELVPAVAPAAAAVVWQAVDGPASG